MMNCNQVRELEPLAALDLLEEEDAAAVLEHLQSCNKHEAIAQYRAGLLALDLAAEPVEPSAGLRARVANRNGRGSVRHLRPYWLVGGISAAVVAVFAVFLAFQLPGGGDSETIARSFETDTGIAVTIDAALDEPRVNLALANLDIAEDRQFTAWAIRDGDWLKMGTFLANDKGGWDGTFTFQMHATDALCVTRGAADGPYPPGEPLFIEPL